MTKNQGTEAKIRDGILYMLEDDTHGRRSIHWLADRTGIPYSTLQQKIKNRPEKFDTAELVKIADVLSVSLVDMPRLGDLYANTRTKDAA